MRPWPTRIWHACAALLLAAPLVAAAPRGEPSTDRFLVGQFLIATPTMRDPRFAQTVILMIKHDRTGAFGIVINRPAGHRTLANLLSESGEHDPEVFGSVPVFLGGPVQPELGFIIHSGEYRRPETKPINDRVSMTTSRDIVRDIGRGKGPEKSLFAFGYSGWAPGQLEREMARKDWYTAAFDFKLLFDQDRDRVWEDAVARRTREL